MLVPAARIERGEVAPPAVCDPLVPERLEPSYLLAQLCTTAFRIAESDGDAGADILDSIQDEAHVDPGSSAACGLHERDGLIRVEVEDDGSGAADMAAGSGLRGLADRVGALAGRLEVDSSPGRGTTVRASLPARR